jgi:hypothetical protein
MRTAVLNWMKKTTIWGCVDKLEKMSAEERTEHEESVRPLRLLLTKACYFYNRLQATLTCLQL